jgi:hypothetical protein
MDHPNEVNQSSLQRVNRLYSDYRNAGFDKSTIIRKLKSQFSSAKFEYKGSTLYVSFSGNAPQKLTGSTEVKLQADAKQVVLSYDRMKMKQLEKSFAEQLRKSGASGVEVTFISDSEINICTPNRHAFEIAKKVMKTVPGLTFSKEDIFEDEDLDQPEFMAWFKF